MIIEKASAVKNIKLNASDNLTFARLVLLEC